MYRIGVSCVVFCKNAEESTDFLIKLGPIRSKIESEVAMFDDVKKKLRKI